MDITKSLGENPMGLLSNRGKEGEKKLVKSKAESRRKGVMLEKVY